MRIIRGAEAAPMEPLRGRTVAVLGYGNQGRAHAENLRDSGVHVLVGNRPGTPGCRRAEASGFAPRPIAEAAAAADLVVMALPDEAAPAIYRDQVGPHLRAGAVVGFLHGFNIRYGSITPSQAVGVVMVAPKGPGDTLRRLYIEGRGLPCLFAVHQEVPQGDGNSAEAIGLAWAAAIGAARAAIVCTSFADETETDLFGEQAVLCGGLGSLMRAAFETLVAAGYPAELAYLECCHEVKQIADLVYERGLAETFEAISSTAEFGAYRAGPALIDASLRRRLDRLLEEIRDGTFAAVMRADHERGFPWFEARRREARSHAMEPAGQIVRSLMPWLGGGETA